MRKRHWLAGLLSGWLSVIGGQALAQPPQIDPGYVGSPDMSGMLPAPYGANYGSYPMTYSRGAAFPPEATAWPNVSPYMGPAVDQTANENGMWFRDIINGNRKYYFTSEALLGYTSIPNATVGAPNVNVINLPAYILPIGSLQNNTSQFQQTAPGTSNLNTPDRQLSGSTGTTGGSTNGTTGTTGTSTPVFATQTTGEIPNDLVTGGIRGTWGWWNADESGFQASGFMLNQVHSTLDIADPNGFDPNFFLATSNATNNTNLQQFLLNELHAIAGIPLGGADTDQNGLPGVVQPFDMYYILVYQSQVGGANADYIASALFKRDAIKVRPVVGGRYLTVREKFMFEGADTGLGYQINSPGSGGTGGTGTGTTGTTGTGTTGTTAGYLSPVAGSLEGTSGLAFFSPMYSALTSTTTTQLAGPEAGLRFDVGKENFNIVATSKLGLLINYTSRTLNGYNIGDAYYPKTNGTLTDPTVMPRATPTNGVPNNTFASTYSTTTFSPMFEQSVLLKAKLFQYTPVLNRSSIFSNAEFQLGYTAIFVGGVARAGSDINWQAYPVNPSLTSYKNTFFTSNYSLGVQWNY